MENEILRRRLKSKVMTTPEERERLLRYGLPLGAGIRDLITIVQPKAFLRWAREMGERTEDGE